MENYSIKQQSVTITPNFEAEELQGYTHIVVQKQTVLNEISLFANQLIIESVTFDRNTVEYFYPPQEYLAQQIAEELKDTRDHKSWASKTFWMWDYENYQLGRLNIKIPYEYSECNTINIHIHYKINQPILGVKFYCLEGEKFLLTDNFFESRRYWMPCNDLLNAKYRLILNFNVVKPYIAISSGKLQADQKFQYICDNIYINSVGFCIGKFSNIVQDPYSQIVTHFTEKNLQELQYTINTSDVSIANLFNYIQGITSLPYPHDQLKVLYIPSLPKIMGFSGLVLFDRNRLITPQVYENRNKSILKMAVATSYTWFGGIISMDSWNDTWLITGLQQYIGYSYLEDRKGTNVVKDFIRKRVKKFCNYVEKGLEQKPLYSSFNCHPNEYLTDSVFQIKSLLIFRMIELKIGKVHLHSVIKSKLIDNCNTKFFVSSFKKLCGVSLRDFARVWINGTGALEIDCSVQYDKKNSQIDLYITQAPLFEKFLQTHANIEFIQINEREYEMPILMNSLRFYKGALTVEIHETDGYDNDSSYRPIQIEGQQYFTQVPCKKRIKRPNNSKRGGDNDEERKARNLDCSLQWIRIDPNYELLRKTKVNQSEEMWHMMLKGQSTDIIGLYEAIEAVRESTNYQIITTLYEILKSQEIWYGVRKKAAKALALMSQPINAHKGLDLLIYYMKQRYFDDNFLRPNNFLSQEEYFIGKVILKSISLVNDMSLTHNFQRLKVNSNVLVEFLKTFLNQNDNSYSNIDDCYWRGNILYAIASTTNPIYIDYILNELEHYRRVDLTLPSNQFIITQHIIKSLKQLIQNHKLQNDERVEKQSEQFQQNIRYYSNKVQKQIVNFQIWLKYQQGSQFEQIYNYAINQIWRKHKYTSLFESTFLLLRQMLQDQPEQLLRLRKDIEVQDNLWKNLTSPFSCIDPYFKWHISMLYRYIYGHNWNRETKDPQWQQVTVSLNQDPEEIRIQLGDIIIGQSQQNPNMITIVPQKQQRPQVQQINTNIGDWQDWAYEILGRLKNNDYSEPFLEPVNWRALNLPDYPVKVKNPMDLQTVTTKFNDGMYINFKEFYDDIKLIFSNCRSYNDELSEMYKYAEEMDNFFISIADPVKKKCAEETGLKLKMRISGNELKLD